MITTFDAFVAAAAFVAPTKGAAHEPVFALGDGTVRFGGRLSIEAHNGAILCAVPHPSGVGLVTGGDDGNVKWTTVEGPVTLAKAARGWINALAGSAQSGLIAFATGRSVHVLEAADNTFSRVFEHERTVASLEFDAKGRRLAAATYGGVVLWYARIFDQKPQMLKWAGSHLTAVFSPDGRFLLSAMQENALHGWRLSDGADLRMGGYPGKPKSLVFLAKGALLATSGANGAVVWPFSGGSGPMGKEAAVVGHDDGTLITCVAAHPSGFLLLAGRSDGRVFKADLKGVGVVTIGDAQGSPITAIAVSPDGRSAAWGAEDGSWALVPLD